MLLCARVALASEPITINKTHLLSLIERVRVSGDSVYVVDIYSDYPSYKPVEAKGEGFACIDDAARAAVFFIRYNEVLQKNEDEFIIDGLIRFVMQMQTREGKFYNFLERQNGEVTINKGGRTSYASFGWWAARAIWALGEAADYYKERDVNIYRRIIRASERSVPQIDSLLRNYGKLDSLRNPTWLLYGDGGDATSELVLGLNRLYEATGDSRYIGMSKQFCDGMVRLQSGQSILYDAFYSNHDGWHGWANSQSTAILEYVRLSHDSLVGKSALLEVNYFLPRWAGALFFRSCNTHGRNIDYSGQIAYAIRPAVTAAAEAYDMTHDRKYQTIACILSSWFFGNNTAGKVFYSSATGVCFDGTEDSLQVNRNSGAESTVEALLTMVELKKINADFQGITLISHPTFDANYYIFRIDGEKREMKLDANGFTIE